MQLKISNKKVRIKNDIIYCDNLPFYKFNRKKLYKAMGKSGVAKKDFNKLLNKIVNQHLEDVKNLLNQNFDEFICKKAENMRGEILGEVLGILK